MKTHKGFTLFEIMVALLIFAILAVLAGITLHTVLKTHKRVKQVDAQLLRLNIALVYWHRDVSQIANRPVMDQYQKPLPAVMSHGVAQTEFTTNAGYNPNFVFRKSNMVRVAFGFDAKKKAFSEWIWPVLDRVASDAKPIEKILVNHVQSLSINYLTSDRSWASNWPQKNQSTRSSSNANNAALPMAIKLTMQLKHFGSIIDIVNLPGANRYASD